jgi:hypothetical protein
MIPRLRFEFRAAFRAIDSSVSRFRVASSEEDERMLRAGEVDCELINICANRTRRNSCVCGCKVVKSSGFERIVSVINE